MKLCKIIQYFRLIMLPFSYIPSLIPYEKNKKHPTFFHIIQKRPRNSFSEHPHHHNSCQKRCKISYFISGTTISPEPT